MALVLCAVGAYTVAFLSLYPIWGAESAALIVLPVIATAWYFGLRSGLLTGLLGFPFNVLLLHWAGGMDWILLLEHTGPGALAGIGTGFAVGLLHDRSEQLKHHLAEHRAGQEILHQDGAGTKALLSALPDLTLRLNRTGAILDV